jgi:hypothetical protein
MIFPQQPNQTNQMKLTIEIPNEHAHALLSLLANLTATPTELVADPCPGHPELPLTPSEQYMAARMAEGELEEIGSLNTPDLAAKWVAAGGDVPPTPEQLAAMIRLPDEDPALADVRWQATPEAAPEPEPWDEPTPTAAAVGFATGTNGKLEVVALDETNPDPTQRVLVWPQELLSIALPELPKGKTKWVYRGTFGALRHKANKGAVYYYDEYRWSPTYCFSTSFHHIEAI